MCQFSLGQSWRRGTNCNCTRDKLWVRFPLEEMKYLIFYAALSSATQHAMPPKIRRENGFALSLLYAGYSGKLKKKLITKNIFNEGSSSIFNVQKQSTPAVAGRRRGQLTINHQFQLQLHAVYNIYLYNNMWN